MFSAILFLVTLNNDGKLETQLWHLISLVDCDWVVRCGFSQILEHFPQQSITAFLQFSMLLLFFVTKKSLAYIGCTAIEDVAFVLIRWI